MKKTVYQDFAITSHEVVYYNALNNAYLVLNHRMHELYQNSSLDDIKIKNFKLYNILKNNGFIVDDALNEFKVAQYNRLLSKFNLNEYDITLNTTLDCNHSCWYCYENKIKGSKVNSNVLDLIKKNIEEKYTESPFSLLKVNFFGGEPLMEFSTVKELLLFANKFVNNNKLRLSVNFTTNATLLTDEMIEFLKDYSVSFQITLDGYKEKHNKIRFFNNDRAIDSYATVIQNIGKIQTTIPNSHNYIRINFDNKTLFNIDEILSDIDHLDRKRNTIILRKVWQVEPAKIDKNIIINTLLKIISKGFFVDYFALPRVKSCFAEKVNQVLFNYDGKVFKCSTIERFDDENVEGYMSDNGNIHWNQMDVVNKILHIPSKECSDCSIYPACYGPCSKSKKSNCILNDLNLTKEEYILYNFHQRMTFFNDR